MLATGALSSAMDADLPGARVVEAGDAAAGDARAFVAAQDRAALPPRRSSQRSRACHARVPRTRASDIITPSGAIGHRRSRSCQAASTSSRCRLAATSAGAASSKSRRSAHASSPQRRRAVERERHLLRRQRAQLRSQLPADRVVQAAQAARQDPRRDRRQRASPLVDARPVEASQHVCRQRRLAPRAVIDPGHERRQRLARGRDRRRRAAPGRGRQRRARLRDRRPHAVRLRRQDQRRDARDLRVHVGIGVVDHDPASRVALGQHAIAVAQADLHSAAGQPLARRRAAIAGDDLGNLAAPARHRRVDVDQRPPCRARSPARARRPARAAAMIGPTTAAGRPRPCWASTSAV